MVWAISEDFLQEELTHQQSFKCSPVEWAEIWADSAKEVMMIWVAFLACLATWAVVKEAEEAINTLLLDSVD